MQRDGSTLDLKIRRKIYNHIKDHPGLHERELSRQLNIPISTLDYHLHHLKKRELITTNSEGYNISYYIVGHISKFDKKIISILRQQLPRQIIIFLLINKYSTNKDICNHLTLPSNAVSFHLNKLVKLDLIDRNKIGREMIYSIINQENISDLIIIYRKSFLDDAVDRFVDTWLKLHPKHIRKKTDKKDND